ncbi:MAG: AmmeMemoRadiSam system protein B [Candidatus Magnetoovum sp. WYHC-5]|nr:AmmeMemoRadiSam system protein B [Candidatus Magnetoovum sp. WYHC-5]
MNTFKNWKFALSLCIVVVALIFIVLFSTKPNPVQKEETLAKPSATPAEAIKNVQKSVVAGSFYPSKLKDLDMFIELVLKDTKKKDFTGKIKALIVPHAGYIYSGHTAAAGFAQLNKDYKKVFIIGSNHNEEADFTGISIPKATHYETPMGEIKVSNIANDILMKQPGLFVTNEKANETHIIEVELPFLQKTLSDFEIIPMITGKITYKEVIKAANVIKHYLDDDTLIVISSDLSHYHHYEEAKDIDTACIAAIKDMDMAFMPKCQACGLAAIHILLNIALGDSYEAEIVEYKNSGDTMGDKEKVVGYSSIVFYKSGEGSVEAKKSLLTLSRDVLEGYVKEKNDKPNIDILKLPQMTKESKGCFVTLESNDELRGCIGSILTKKTLAECIVENTVKAAAFDPRFPPVNADELKNISVEISILSTPKKVSAKTPEELLKTLKPLRHGVILVNGEKSATYLPNVWLSFPSKEEFLQSLCKKGDMLPDCWRIKSTEIFTYTADVLAEVK